MQPLPYYQSAYPNTASYSSNPSYSTHGSPVPSSVMATPNPMMPQPNMSSLAHPVGTTTPGISNETTTAAPTAQPPKRKQVKNACTNCQKACKKCDDARPCPRCIKYGIADTCVNSVRKERKKGIKRGPYKRRQKDGDSSSSSSTRKADDPLMAGQQQNPYAAAMRHPTMPYSPYTMNQYGQPTYDPYGSYAAAYHKDHMLPQSYVVNPVYSSLGYPMFMPTAGASSSDSQQQQQQSQSPQQSNATPTATASSAYQHYVGYMQQHHQQATSRYGDHLIHSQQQQQQHPSHQGHGSTSPAAAHLYYQHPSQAQQQQQQTGRLSPQLPDIKSESHSSSPVAANAVPGSFMKAQAMTPIPSASTSSGTTASPAEPNEDDARLPQLCNVALQNSATAASSNDQPSSNTASPTNPQQHS
ncbi:hypothetical protein RO3G_03663 [Lichtheimia corymbifera JMRC:FSU:9682]|uniref:Zn(2)-C6 fungal-type domain-containing protein n=1 Tax=Lichtheimia corymbifera JMRC:FSU:9682 TaxID=1263082 RepID=A0A068RR33_9FUNG|nr:hypothetical protein RO3G_03663 [Lichtheimia corymbifera JMRC:FSU:9682]